MKTLQPKYTIYIPSKGRWENRKTVRTLIDMGIEKWFVVVEPVDYEEYAKVIDKEHILTLPFSNLGKGSIPARNWIWEYSKAQGEKRHWILDDNIDGVIRLHKNTRLPVRSGLPFYTVEEFTERFKNVPMSGMHYRYMVPVDAKRSLFTKNTRVYSCILLDNSVEERWRVLQLNGKDAPFNEDTDLSLQFLEKGYCTVLFNQFLINKGNTLKEKGGNTDTVYKVNQQGFDNRFSFAASLQEAHPDVVSVVKKYGRWHHHVDYAPFKNNKFIPVDNWKPPEFIPKLKLINDIDREKGLYTEVDIEDIRMKLESE